MSDATYAI
uniref:Uncharacterized protein n=1 Tax=Arundo donax TaxID=35708 RepID=A0A0A8Y7A9_ARUDO